MNEWLGRLLDHMEWADAALIESLESQGASEKVRGLMDHILAAERLWLARARGEDTRGIVVWPVLAHPQRVALAAANATGLRSLIAPAGEADLALGIVYTNSKGERFESRLDDVCLHVFLHGSYPRGQIAVLQRADGRQPLYTDFIHYVRSVRGRT